MSACLRAPALTSGLASLAGPKHAARVNRREFLRAIGAAATAVAAFGPAHAGTAATLDVIRDAIHRQRTLRLRYGGHMRLVDPHALGISAGGHAAVLAWQVEGGSRSEPPSGWRTFLISEIGDIAVTVRGFTPQRTYDRDRANLRAIEVEVTLPPADAPTNPPATGRG